MRNIAAFLLSSILVACMGCSDDPGGPAAPGGPSNAPVLLEPASGTLRTAGPVILKADPGGSATELQFVADGAVIGARREAPYEVSWQPQGEGRHVLQVVATTPDGIRLGSEVLVEIVSPFGLLLSRPAHWTDVGDSVESVVEPIEPDRSLVEVRWFLAGGADPVAVDSVAPFRQMLATAGLQPGPHTLYARARDAGENEGITPMIIIHRDQQAPHVVLLEPAAWQRVDSVLAIRAWVIDNHEVDRVEFSLGAASLGSGTGPDAGSVYELAGWDTRLWPDGNHTLLCRAYDKAGNVGYANITVEIRNQANRPVLAASGR